MLKIGGHTGYDEEVFSGWEKCSRTILLNTKEEIFDLLDLLQRLCRNILLNPDDPKYRIIKLNNKTIQSRLLGRKGGLEFLSAVGFRTVVVDGTRTLQLDIDDVDREVRLVEIEESLSWLASTVDTCVHIAEESHRYGFLSVFTVFNVGF